jgi:DNA-binding transcriptional MerR regulator
VSKSVYTPQVNIQAVSRRTGVPAATLRKWEQRYGVLKPERTAGHHRRYSDRDVLRVEWLKARLADGYRIGEAASLLGGEQEIRPTSNTRELAEELLAAAVVPDPARISRTLDLAFTLHGPERGIAEVVTPALRRVGELWRSGELAVAEEHHLTAQVLGKLRGLLDGTGPGPRGTAVLCCVPGERHEVGLYSLAVLLAADGWRVVYLGPDTPLASAVELSEDVGARVLCVGATMAEYADAARHELREIEHDHPDLLVVRGGAAFDGPAAPDAVHRLRAPAGR